MYKVAFETFGCRLNQAETATLEGRYREMGYEVTDDPYAADLYVVNTCSLTSRAAAKCRRRIRSVLRSNPGACVAAVGCYAQTHAESLERIPGIDLIVGTADKLDLPRLVPEPVKLPEPRVVRSDGGRGAFRVDGVAYYARHTRANIKVQEGCDFVCAFCLVPRSRGRARSREFADVLREARALAAAGHRELVVTGVNMGTYRDGRYTFADVVDALCDVEGIDRVRLSSIEPTTIEDRVVARMAEGGTLCPYLHVPLQSGDDAVLRRMRRRYDAATYLRFMRSVVDRVPGVGFGTDVIVGFPGETGQALRNTEAVIEALPFANVHVFGFSARPRTSAERMPDRVPPEEVRRRRARLHALAIERRRVFLEGLVGTTQRVLFEERDARGRWIGFSDNYARVVVDTPRDLANRLLHVEVTGLDDAAERVAGDRAAPVAVGRPAATADTAGGADGPAAGGGATGTGGTPGVGGADAGGEGAR